MKKMLCGLIMILAGSAMTFAQDYAPTTNDDALMSLLTPMVMELSEGQKVGIKLMIETKLPDFAEGTRKHRFALVLIELIEAKPVVLIAPMELAPVVPAALVVSGDSIGVMYKGTLEDGTLFDTNMVDVAQEYGTYDTRIPYTPLEFEVGAKQMIAGFDAGVVGMKVGETKTLVIPPEDAYGFGSHFLAGETLVFEVTVVEIE